MLTDKQKQLAKQLIAERPLRQNRPSRRPTAVIGLSRKPSPVDQADNLERELTREEIRADNELARKRSHANDHQKRQAEEELRKKQAAIHNAGHATMGAGNRALREVEDMGMGRF